MRFGRLLEMGLPELSCRGRQEIRKRLDRLGLLPTPSLHLHDDPLVLLERFRDSSPSRFFDGAGDHQTPTFLAEHTPWARDDVAATAQTICQKRFDLLGYRGLTFGDPVDWHLDPVSGRRAPLVHWARINLEDAAAVGDVKVVWELNRHQWLVHLGLAYRMTADERYAERFATSIGEWTASNPPGFGINWASSLELAYRLISWCWALLLFRDSKALSPHLFATMLSAILAHSTHVESYLSHYFSPNTHLTGEALGLFYVGILFPELRDAPRWRALGAQILVEQSERQVLPDGVYFEQSTCYQRYTVEIYLHFLILAGRNGVAVPTAVRERIERMLDFLLAVRRPDGSMPQIGDADGGSLLPLARRAADDFRGVFSTAAAFLGRSDYKWAAGGLASETLWLLGGAGLRAFEALAPAPPAAAPSRVFADGGYVVMRSGWEAKAHQMIFDVGPLGCPVSGGHGHADLLSIQCAAFGKAYLVDPGTYNYAANPGWRNFFRGTTAHSTVIVDGMEQATAAGPFRWKARPRARLRGWLSTDAFDLADAEHDAYRCLSDPITHRRRVLFVKSRYWVIVDDLNGGAEHRIELRFQFAPIKVSVDPALWARACRPDGRGLLVRPFATVPLKAEVREGEVDPPQGWVSPDYGQRRSAPLLVYSTVSYLPIRIVSLLMPVEDPFASPPSVSPLLADGSGPLGLIFGDSQESIRLDDGDLVTLHPSGPEGRWRT